MVITLLTGVRGDPYIGITITGIITTGTIITTAITEEAITTVTRHGELPITVPAG